VSILPDGLFVSGVAGLWWWWRSSAIGHDQVVPPPSEPIKELGYFSLVCLACAHVQYGDYYLSLKPWCEVAGVPVQTEVDYIALT
jgi:hypothetical protein